MKQVIGKYKLELNIVGDGRTFLNFWDWAHGNDVVVELQDGKLMYNDSGNIKEITFDQFCEKVKQSISERTI